MTSIADHYKTYTPNFALQSTMGEIRKGGKRPRVPPSGLEALTELELALLDKHKKEGVLEFHGYENVGLAQAVFGLGLLQNEDFLRQILKIAASASIRSDVIKVAFRVILTRNRLVKGGQPKAAWSDSVWIAHRAERVGVMLHHLRRLKREEVRRHQCFSKLALPEIERLQHLIDMVDLSAGEWDGDSQGGTDSLEPEPTRAKTVSPEVTHRRILQREVSLDSEGYPRFLRSEEV